MVNSAVAIAVVVPISITFFAVEPGGGSVLGAVFNTGALLVAMGAFFLGVLVWIGRRREAERVERAQRAEALARDRWTEAALADPDLLEPAWRAGYLSAPQGQGGTLLVRAEAGSVVSARRARAKRRRPELVPNPGRGVVALLRRVLGLLNVARKPPPPGTADILEVAERVSFSGLRVDVRQSGEARTLPRELDSVAYRIVEESLTNAMKHATTATLVEVRLDWWGRGLMVTVVDDGKGVAALAATPGRQGGGLTDIRRWAADHGGQAEIGPAPDGGYRVMAWLPYPARDAAGSTTRTRRP